MPQATRGARGARRRAARLCQSLLRRVRPRGRVLLSAVAPRILGVDPGSGCTGWALISGTVHSPTLIDFGEIRLRTRAPFATRLAVLGERFERVVLHAKPTDSAVEAPFHGANARSALQLAHARGVILSVLAAAGVPPIEYAPATVKLTVSGNGRAGKDQVRTMVARLTGRRAEDISHDVADAIAVALCHQAHLRRPDAR